MRSFKAPLVVLLLLGMGVFPVYQACHIQLGASTAGNPSGTGKGGLPNGLESFFGGLLKVQVENVIPNLAAMPTYRTDLKWFIINAKILNPNENTSGSSVRVFLVPRGAADFEKENHGEAVVYWQSDGTFTAQINISRPLISGMHYRFAFSDLSSNKIRQSTTNEFQFGPGNTSQTEIPGGTLDENCAAIQPEVARWKNQPHPFLEKTLPSEGTSVNTSSLQNPYFYEVTWSDAGLEYALNPYQFANAVATDLLSSRWGSPTLESLPQGSIQCRTSASAPKESGVACAKRVFTFNGYQFSVGDVLSLYMNHSEFYAEFAIRSKIANALSYAVPSPLVSACLWRAGESALGLRPSP